MMSQVFAKVRIRGNRNKYRKILSTTEQVYHSPDELINSSCVYSPGANLDEGELVQNFRVFSKGIFY